MPTKQEDCAASGKEPDGHAVQAAEPAPATDPGGHFTHVSGDAARRAALDVPAGHSVHTEEPSESLYAPSTQSEQSAALLPPILDRAVPAVQNWSQKAEPFAITQEPGGQRRHAERPVTGV